jgi:hypothetical protein
MTPRDLERAREIVTLYVKEAFWPDYGTLTSAIAIALADERERTHDTTALAAALSTWDDRAFNAMLALPHGAIVVQELRAIRARGGA